MRVAGFLDDCTGALLCWDASKITASKLARCFKEVSAAYAGYETVYVAIDNWPVHFHPKVEAALAASPNIRILRLPTYSPWLNPIEKVWRFARQKAAHAHRLSGDFGAFKDRIRDCLAGTAADLQALLQYVGLYA